MKVFVEINFVLSCFQRETLPDTELDLREEAANEHGGAATGELNGRALSSVQNSHSQPLLSGVMGTLDSVRRSQQSESSPTLAQFEQGVGLLP